MLTFGVVQPLYQAVSQLVARTGTGDLAVLSGGGAEHGRPPHRRPRPGRWRLGHRAGAGASLRSTVVIHSRSIGTGPVILWTHGFGDSTAAWDAQADHFAERGFTSIVWDLRAHGRSGAPADPGLYDHEHALSDMVELLDGRTAVLAGHSLGGFLSMTYALRRPEQVRALVLVATGPGFRDEERRAAWNRRAHDGIASGTYRVPARSVGLLMQYTSEVRDGLERITVPVLQIAGERDVAFGPAQRVIAARVGGPCTNLVVPGAGHHVHRSAPEPVNAAIAEFLAGVP